ncbi:Aldehyde dehydrogenase, conserved site-containing protein, partial [Cynara cardunculus var. scolymus]
RQKTINNGVAINRQRLYPPKQFIFNHTHQKPIHLREEDMAEIHSNGSSKSSAKIPKIKFTKLFINGEFVDSVSGRTFETIDPRTEEVIANIAEGDKEDVDLAVKAALQENLEELVALDAIDAGKVFEQAKAGEMPFAASILRYYAGAADKIHGKTMKMANQLQGYTLHEPIGVVGHIIPWNFPAGMFFFKTSPAMAAGCTMVAGIPDGVINVITGFGTTAGAAISSHMDIDCLSFTGSTEVGRVVMQAAATSNLKAVSLELGGKSPLIIFNDADVDSTGEFCVCSSRIFVQEGIYEEFITKLARNAKGINVGDPFDPSTHQGPQVIETLYSNTNYFKKKICVVTTLINNVDKQQYEKVLSYIEHGKRQGATLLTGGKPWEKKGYYIEPTIFTNVTAITRANSTRYGLAAGIATKDLNIANTVSRSLHAGTVWINCYLAFDADVPYGGYKGSGFGREFGMEGLYKYLQVKSVVTPKKTWHKFITMATPNLQSKSPKSSSPSSSSMENLSIPFQVTFETIDPRTEEVIANVAEGDKEDVDLAVKSARFAFDHGPWPRFSGSERGRIMMKFVDLVLENLEELAALDAIDAGKTMKMANQLQGYTLHEPIGVVGHIIPWNFPISMFFFKASPSMAAGCTMVIKPAEHSHMDIDCVSFTGSAEVGRLVMQAAATSNLKSVSLELGGKSPLIIFDDVDVDSIVNLAILGSFANKGEFCVCSSRIFVQEGIYEEFITKFVKSAKEITVGDPFEPKTRQGPQVDKQQHEKILSYIEHGKRQGATLLTGGKPCGEKGYYIEPTIFTNVTDDMLIATDEIFGPVISVFKFKSLRAGIVWINCYLAFDADAPYGGYKGSGFGREFGMEGLYKYLQVKSVVTPIHNSPWL